jgi:hypothetical protein
METISNEQFCFEGQRAGRQTETEPKHSRNKKEQNATREHAISNLL